jgi:hypothetical protein
MRTVEVARVMSPDEADSLVGETVHVQAPEPVRDDTMWIDASTKEPVAILARTPYDMKALRHAVLSLKWSDTLRGASGLRNESRTFGYAPRKPVLRREGCGATVLATEQPGAHTTIANLSGPLNDLLAQLLPDKAEELAETPVGTDWRIGHGPWTSGVINKTSALPYHRDGANFDAWSAMPALRRGTRGGHLHIPEYGMTLPVLDSHTLFFNGYRIVHGVTPIEATQPDGYRITIVFYCLRGMKDCHTYAEETRYARAKRTERERKLAASIDAGEAPEWIDSKVPMRRASLETMIDARFRSREQEPTE